MGEKKKSVINIISLFIKSSKERHLEVEKEEKAKEFGMLRKREGWRRKKRKEKAFENWERI